MSKKGSKIRHFGGKLLQNEENVSKQCPEELAYIKLAAPVGAEEVRKYAEERFRETSACPTGVRDDDSITGIFL